ncbi:hypothetical protein Ahy_B01g055290 [Arachis hypogaea]|uniref:Uncharacterized protein n=1 Tax=Arachis hypogaea TaxID=3818 RepID=A0A445AVX7_ARAHY|nr:hypothetical protein Ahy_B01g055290 [Arachis hypogaea]
MEVAVVRSLAFNDEKTFSVPSFVEAMVVDSLLAVAAAAKSLAYLLIASGSLLKDVNNPVSPMDGRTIELGLTCYNEKHIPDSTVLFPFTPNPKVPRSEDEGSL